MDTTHEPSDEFLAHLEWQTKSALRRRDRFARPVGMRALRSARSAALLLVCFLAGAGVVIGADHLQSTRDKQHLLERNRLLLNLAQSREMAAHGAHEKLRLMYENGLTGAERMLAAEQRLSRAHTERQHLDLERAEIEASGRQPDRRLIAPAFGRRDFVLEHLILDERVASQEVKAAEETLSRTRQLYESGRIATLEVQQAEHPLNLSRLELDLIQTRLKLRSDYLAGKLSAEQCLRQERTRELERRSQSARKRLGILEGELQRLRTMFEAGISSSTEVEWKLVEVEDAQTEIDLYELELRALRR